MSKYVLYLLLFASSIRSAKIELTRNPRPEPAAINIGYITLDKPIDSFLETVKEIKKYTDDPSVDCIVLHINSPGGRPGSSQIIADFITWSKQNKPVIAFISDSGTSGAYWVAAACSYIIAPATSAIGSIGVVAEYPKKNKAISFIAGKYKRPHYLADGVIASDDVHDIQEKLDKNYTIFCQEISRLRGIPVDIIKEFEARVFLGEDAKNLGLIDQVGTLQDVFDYITDLFSTRQETPATLLRLITSPTEAFEFNLSY